LQNESQNPYVLFYLDRHQIQAFLENPEYFTSTDNPGFGDIVTVSSSYQMYEWTKKNAIGIVYEFGPPLGLHRIMNHSAVYVDRNLVFEAADIEPMITYGTNPGMGIKVVGTIPTTDGMEGSNKTSYLKSLDYMGFQPGEPVEGKQVDYVFVGSCTNGRIEDIRSVAQFVKGHKKADNITAWIVPGSREVEKMAHAEGLVKILEEAGFELRQPGCSACLAMNDDKIPSGKYAVSTSNRNFEGRQGPGARTMLASPLTVAAVAITGRITDPREVFGN
jgi:3-isopropylmalate/(R)-2-methylmalate dehydratase large subunit